MKMRRCPDCQAARAAATAAAWEPAFAAAEAKLQEAAAAAAILAQLRDPAQVAADAKEGEAAFASLD